MNTITNPPPCLLSDLIISYWKILYICVHLVTAYLLFSFFSCPPLRSILWRSFYLLPYLVSYFSPLNQQTKKNSSQLCNNLTLSCIPFYVWAIILGYSVNISLHFLHAIVFLHIVDAFIWAVCTRHFLVKVTGHFLELFSSDAVVCPQESALRNAVHPYHIFLDTLSTYNY